MRVHLLRQHPHLVRLQHVAQLLEALRQSLLRYTLRLPAAPPSLTRPNDGRGSTLPASNAAQQSIIWRVGCPELPPSTSRAAAVGAQLWSKRGNGRLQQEATAL